MLDEGDRLVMLPAVFTKHNIVPTVIMQPDGCVSFQIIQNIPPASV